MIVGEEEQANGWKTTFTGYFKTYKGCVRVYIHMNAHTRPFSSCALHERFLAITVCFTTSRRFSHHIIRRSWEMLYFFADNWTFGTRDLKFRVFIFELRRLVCTDIKRVLDIFTYLCATFWLLCLIERGRTNSFYSSLALLCNQVSIARIPDNRER